MIDKLILIRLYAIKKRRPLYYIDAKKITRDYSKAEEALNYFAQAESIVIFVNNLEYLDKKLSGTSSDRQSALVKLRKKLASLSTKSSVNVVFSSDLSDKELQEHYSQIKSYSPIASQNPSAYMEFSSLNSIQCEELILEILFNSELVPDKVPGLVPSLLNVCKNLSITETHHYVQEYIKWSTIIFGKMIKPDKFYDNIGQKDADKLLGLDLF